MEQTFTTILLPALLGGVGGYLAALLKSVLDMRAKVDEELRTARAGVYKPLWQRMELLPQWPRATNVTYKDLKDLSEAFRDWYFKEGGIYLSHTARKKYGDAQEAMTQAFQKNDLATVISGQDYDVVREKLSLLRTELTNDLLSRRRALLV